MENNKSFNRILDFFLVLGTVLVLFTHFSKDYIPSFLFPFFGSDKVLSIYPFFIFSLLALFLLFNKREYKKLLFLLLALLVFCFGYLAITEHGLLKIIERVTEYDVERLEGSRLSFFNIVSKLFDNKDIHFRLIISEGLFSLYAAFNQFKEIFLVAFLIGFTYKDRLEDIKKCLFIGLLISFGVVVLYEFIEFPHLWGSEHSVELQTKINPFLHEVYLNGTWWPPLIWQDHVLRNVFAEPSFFGYYLGFTIVAFIHLLLNYKKKIIWAVLLFLSYLFAFLTNSRSGIMLALVGTVVYCVVYAIKERKIKEIFIVLLVFMLAFAGNNVVERIKVDHGIVTASNSYVEEKNDIVISPLDGNVFEVVKASFEPGDGIKSSISESSIVRTIKTVFSLSARSNSTRYGCTFAEFSIGLDNPILGVGDLYVDNYKPEALEKLGFSNGELSGWIYKQGETGLLNGTFASFNAFTSAFAEGGIVGVVLETGLLLFLVIVYCIRLVKSKIDFKTISIMIFSMLAVVFAWGFSNNLQENYLYVIILGFGLADVLSSGILLKHSKTNV